MPPRPSPLSRSSFPISKALAILRRAARAWKLPMVTELSAALRDPFAVLISTMLSLRTKDATTAAASDRLFALAATPRAMQALDAGAVARAIFPVGFYRTKAAHILATCRILVDRFGGEVPSDLDALLELPGVGRKTANLVLSACFGQPGLIVDTHVLRASLRLGLAERPDPTAVEARLALLLEPSMRTAFSHALNRHGKHVCRARRPACAAAWGEEEPCPLLALCPRVGLEPGAKPPRR